MRLLWHHYGLIVALIAAGILSHFASESPDGLERVAEDMGFISSGEGHGVLSAPMPDYSLPFLGDGRASSSVAAVIGTVVVYLGVLGLTKALKANEKRGKVGG